MPDRRRADAFPGKRWVERMLTGLPKGAHILDLGCGGGEPIGRLLLDRGYALTGIDLAGSQIALAQTRFPRGTWIKGDMRTFVFDGTFDGVIAWNSLSWLSHADQALMATRTAHWMAPGGRLLFNLEPERDATLSDYRVGTPYRAELEATNYTAEIHQRGLILVDHVAEDPSCGNAGIWVARKP